MPRLLSWTLDGFDKEKTLERKVKKLARENRILDLEEEVDKLEREGDTKRVAASKSNRKSS